MDEGGGGGGGLAMSDCDYTCVCIRLVDDPVIVGELAFRGEYVIAGGRPSRDASISVARGRGRGRGRGRRGGEALFPAVSGADDIRFHSSRFRYQVPRFITSIESTRSA